MALKCWAQYIKTSQVNQNITRVLHQPPCQTLTFISMMDTQYIITAHEDKL